MRSLIEQRRFAAGAGRTCAFVSMDLQRLICRPTRVPHPTAETDPDLVRLELAAVEGVALAMEVARSVQGRVARAPGEPPLPSTDADGVRKLDDSPVTVADFAVQAIVTHMLRTRSGIDLAVIGEESAETLRDGPSTSRRPLRDAVVETARSVFSELDEDAVLGLLDLGVSSGRPLGGPDKAWWLIDPIDGTKGFLRGQQYCVALALVRSGQVQLAILGCPNLDEDPGRPLDDHPRHGIILVAHAGRGCQVRSEADFAKPSAPIRRSGSSSEVRVCGSVAAAPSTRGRLASILHQAFDGDPRLIRMIRLDSQCKYALVARDQSDVFLRLPRPTSVIERTWDHAAGSLVAAESGAWTGDVDGIPLDFSHGDALSANRGALACDPSLAPPLLDAIRIVLSPRTTPP